MTAKELREAGLLWPQTLTDAELEQEYGAIDAQSSPISARMLREEIVRRDRFHARANFLRPEEKA